MPRDVIQIAVFKAAPAEAVSDLLSYLAYPDSRDKSQRQMFAASLYRFALIHRAESDKAWGQSLQEIRPTVLLQDEKVFLSSLKRGTKVLGRHMFTAYTFLMPHFIELSTGEKAPGLDVLHPTAEILDAKDSVPTVENMSLLVMKALGWKSKESDTFEKDIWSAAKPVAHLGYAMASLLAGQALTQADGYYTTNLFPDMFFNENLLVYIVMAENCRKKLPSVTQFKIKEEDTVQFIAV